MNNIIRSILAMHRSIDSKEVLKSTETSFSVFTSDTISLAKTVDKPDDYYFPGDLITYIFKLKNVGDKNIKDFTLRDDCVSKIDPLPNGYYEVLTTNGEVSFTLDEVVISGISLAPGDELEITVTGVVRPLEASETTDEEITF